MAITINGSVRQRAKSNQRGMTLIELMIAMVVLLIGITASLSLVSISVSGNGRNRQQSNSTVISQMVAEKIASVKASTSPILTITDCTGGSVTTGTAYNINTAAGGGALNGSGDVDFTQAQVAGYSMNYTACGTGGRQMTYDVRWTVRQTTGSVKFITVTTRLRNAGTDLKMWSPVVTIRTMVGLGT